ncbi:hypothetical protein MLD38_014651 [Melastoma candidum]|uniref:Uncharacterized protein n=1 Tax=Melastoma candidum TaxID=119954 RepID=A0ACB9RDD0_9MYRT|nr:hypothetical protein MLD38_014651 [Melastoma candidum]
MPSRSKGYVDIITVPAKLESTTLVFSYGVGPVSNSARTFEDLRTHSPRTSLCVASPHDSSTGGSDLRHLDIIGEERTERKLEVSNSKGGPIQSRLLRM